MLYNFWLLRVSGRFIYRPRQTRMDHWKRRAEKSDCWFPTTAHQFQDLKESMEYDMRWYCPILGVSQSRLFRDSGILSWFAPNRGANTGGPNGGPRILFHMVPKQGQYLSNKVLAHIITCLCTCKLQVISPKQTTSNKTHYTHAYQALSWCLFQETKRTHHNPNFFLRGNTWNAKLNAKP